jgi:integrase
MARQVDRLSSAKVKHAKPGMHPDGGGLYLQVTVGKDDQVNKSWVFRYALKGKERRMGLGSINTIGLGEARDAAEAARKLIVAGKDPIDERDGAREAAQSAKSKSETFERCAMLYMADHEKGWRSAVHARQWRQSLRDHAFPVLGGMPVDQIDTDAVMKVLAPIWAAKPETASRVRSRIELVLDWATVRKFRNGDNPARWRGHIKHLLPAPSKVRAVANHSAMPYEALPAFLARVRGREAVSARALEFLILAASRTGEVIGARWDEIDVKARVWAIPGPRMKGGLPHRVPLGKRAVEILEWARGLHHALVFPGFHGKTMDEQAMWRVVHAIDDTVTVHGFRSTFKDWCAECTNYSDWVSEKALAHVVGDETRRAYQRGDLFEKRRTLMAEWAEFCNNV